MASSRILLISDNDEHGVAAALATPNLTVTRVADLEAGLASASDPEAIVVDLLDPDATIDTCRGVHAHADLQRVPILAFSETDDIEERIELLKEGVEDVLSRPFDARELEARVEALALRYQRTRDLAATDVSAPVITTRDAGARRLIAVFSPKGGVGTTTVAVNVAVALAARNQNRVAIVDLDLQFGQVATHLNISARTSLLELSRDEVGMRDPGALQAYADRHESTLAVFAAPSSPEAANGISADAIGRILDTAGRGYQTVVVDAGSSFDDRTQAVLQRATDLVVVVTPDFPSLKAVDALREALGPADGRTLELSFVLNQIFAREILRLRDIEDALGTKLTLSIPYDAFVFLKSVNEGVPVVIGAARTGAGEALARLATKLGGAESASAPVADPRRRGGIGGLFGRG